MKHANTQTQPAYHRSSGRPFWDKADLSRTSKRQTLVGMEESDQQPTTKRPLLSDMSYYFTHLLSFYEMACCLLSRIFPNLLMYWPVFCLFTRHTDDCSPVCGEVGIFFKN
jgi:hypothetical protein